MSESTLRLIAGNNQQNRAGDVVFIHGLDGDPIASWHPRGTPTAFWPKWLSEDLPNLSVWSLGYPVAALKWRGDAMPLADRATNALTLMTARKLGLRPIVFVTHSLGGLLAKQMLRHACDLGEPRWKKIADQTRGLILLATPNSGSRLADFVRYMRILRPTAAIDDLRDNDSRLRELNTWFRNSVGRMGIRLAAFSEKRPTGPFIVVDDTSADPGVPGVVPVPLDADHISICKPQTRDSLVYVTVQHFIAELIETASTVPVPESEAPMESADRRSKSDFIRNIGTWRANEINAVAWSPCHRYLAAASDDRTVRIWNAELGEVALLTAVHEDAVRSVHWHPDGHMLACGSADRTVSLIAFPSGSLVTRITGFNDWVRSVSWSPNGQLLGIGSADRSVRIMHNGTWSLHHRLDGHQHFVRAISWSADSSKLATGSMDGSLRIWTADQGAAVGALFLDNGSVTTVAWSPIAEIIAVGTTSGSIFLVDAFAQRILTQSKAHEDAVLSLSWSPTGHALVSGSADRSLKIWGVPGARLLADYRLFGGSVRAVSWSGDGHSIAGGATDQYLRIFSATDLALRHQWKSHAEWFRCAAWSSEHPLLALGARSRSVVVFDTSKGIQLWEQKGFAAIVHTSANKEERIVEKNRDKREEYSRSLAWSPTGDLLALGADDRSVRVCDGKDGRLINALAERHRGPVTCLVWSSDGRVLASASENRLVLWNLQSNTVTSHDDHVGPIDCLAWSPVAAILASSGTDCSVRLWSQEQKRTLVLASTSVRALCWSHDGKFVFGGRSDSRITKWDSEYGTIAGEVETASPVCSIVSHCHNGTLAVAGEDGSITVIDSSDMRTMTRLRSLPPTHRSMSLSFSASASRWKNEARGDFFIAEHICSLVLQRTTDELTLHCASSDTRTESAADRDATWAARLATGSVARPPDGRS